MTHSSLALFRICLEPSMLHPTTPSDDFQQVHEFHRPVIQEIDMDDEEEAPLEPEEEDGDVNGSKKKEIGLMLGEIHLLNTLKTKLMIIARARNTSKDVTRGMKDMKLEGTQSKPQNMSYEELHMAE
ncbi:hypothetical protein HAX54_050866 [Datura stramonium]|uniref:Uncharacterized protein n=1 Tax=Datura stramonium TaxID=4076 RepID=A0ABS8SX07_DATST|nr:hypothetical protein [Datura stramonium]